MSQTVVDKLYQDFNDLLLTIDESEISLRVTAEENFRKSLLLAAASFFEVTVINHLRTEIENCVSHAEFREFFANKALARQYHTFFHWEKANANQFFGLFGTSFKTFMEKKVKGDGELDSSIKAFLGVGNDRNRLVHQNYGSFSLEKSQTEIFEAFKHAQKFVDLLPSLFSEFRAQDETTETV